MTKVLGVVTSLLALGCSSEAVNVASDQQATMGDSQLSGGGEQLVTFDRAVQKSVHNAFERAEPLLDQLIYHRVRSVEIDIHKKRDGQPAPAGEWFVYHEDNVLMRGKTSCFALSDCLGQLAAFHDAVPQHEVVTVWVDLKDDLDGSHAPADLDAAFVRGLGRENVVAPSDLVAACPNAANLRDAVSGACHFPTLETLRGKFIVATTGGSGCDTGSNVARYGGTYSEARLAFVAPDVSSGCSVASLDVRRDTVFFNMAASNQREATEARRRGLVARVYGLNDAGAFAAARSAGATHLVTDKVNVESDAWAVSHGKRGFPFACDLCADLVEAGSVLGIRASSGDQWGSADSAVFAWETDSADATWTALVSVPSSHVEPSAKACLVARASDRPDAASIAVCRPFDDNPPRAQIRATTGGSTTSIDAAGFEGLSRESGAFLRLAVKTTADGTGTEVTTSTSRDGKAWSTIATTTLGTPLALRGASVSAHGSTPVKGLFANLVRKRAGASAAAVRASALQVQRVGANASGVVFDGLFPP